MRYFPATLIGNGHFKTLIVHTNPAYFIIPFVDTLDIKVYAIDCNCKLLHTLKANRFSAAHNCEALLIKLKFTPHSP